MIRQLSIFSVLFIVLLSVTLPQASAVATITLAATTQSGPAPLTVTITATPVGFYGTPNNLASVWYLDDGVTFTHTMSVSHTYITPGVYTAFISATDIRGHSASAQIDITVFALPVADADRYCDETGSWYGDRFDKTAEAPRTCFNTSLKNTPSPGPVSQVIPTLKLETVLNAAQCGQTLLLQAGATYNLNGATLLSKNCDNQHWITVRTNVPDSSIPPEHLRTNPSYAGVGNLPGRPQFGGGSGNTMPKVIITNPGGITLGDHYRFIGIEFTRPDNGKWVNSLFRVSTPYVIFDRSWIHGDPLAETTRGIQFFLGSDHLAVIDSYMNDFHCNAPGSCSDAQTIAATSGGVTIKIVNNFLEAAGENFLLGGGGGEVLTTDVEVRRNHMFKPLTWNPSDPGFIGTKFVVKNLFELKEGKRIFVEGNLMENTWGGFTQTGNAILLTPKNQGANGCPMCELSDVIMRYNYISHTGTAMQIGYFPSGDGYWSAGAHHFSLHDMIFDGLLYAGCYSCGSYTMEIASGYSSTNPPRSVLHDLSLDHFTMIAANKPALSWLLLGGPPANNPTASTQIYNTSLTNFIVSSGPHGFYSTGGGSDNCAVAGTSDYAKMVSACWAGASRLTHNLVTMEFADTRYKRIWPEGNLFTPAPSTIDFANFSTEGGDYHLAITSPYKNGGSDGKDLGADVDAVMRHIEGVR